MKNIKTIIIIIILLFFLVIILSASEEKYTQEISRNFLQADEKLENTKNVAQESTAYSSVYIKEIKKEARQNKPEETKEGLETAKNNLHPIIRVIDGDTIKILIDKKIETIRIIGIDTPEIGSRLECFGNEAKEKALELLSGKKVSIEMDDSQGERGRYGRLLAYLLIDGKVDFGEQMIKQGYSYEYTYNKAYKNQEKYKIAQKYAEENKKGLWAENTCLEYEKEFVKIISLNGVYKKPDGTCAIKGNISIKNKEKIYHTPEQKNYFRTKIDISKGEKWFCTEEEALKAGWRKALR